MTAIVMTGFVPSAGRRAISQAKGRFAATSRVANTPIDMKIAESTRVL